MKNATAQELEKEAYFIARFESSVIIYYFDEYKNEIGYSIEDFPDFGLRCTRNWHNYLLDKLIWTRIIR